MKIAIIVLNWNGYQDTYQCITSLKKSLHDNFEIIVIDNNSSDSSYEKLSKDFPSVTLIKNDQNFGFAEGNNIGIHHALNAQADAILLLNNDTIVDPYMLSHLEATSTENPLCILGTKILRMHKPECLDHFGGKWNKKTFQFDLCGLMEKDTPSLLIPNDLDYVCGCALFARSDLFKTIGMLDPRFFLYWEESDLCQRGKKAGYSIRVCEKACLWHKGSASISGGKPHINYYWWRNRLLFIEKQFAFLKKVHFYLAVFSFELLKLLRHYFLIFLQMHIKKLQKNFLAYQQKKAQLLILKASLWGCFDYFKRRFFEGPAWISKKSS